VALPSTCTTLRRLARAAEESPPDSISPHIATDPFPVSAHLEVCRVHLHLPLIWLFVVFTLCSLRFFI
jgi:hypothetical protein